MVYPNKTIATVSSNINALDISIKRQRMSEWIVNGINQLCYIQEVHFIFKGTVRLKVTGWKKYTMHTVKHKEGWRGYINMR